MIGPNRVKVLDFGLARGTPDSLATAAGQVMGTPAYMAPEQWAGQPADHRADIYALGLVPYEMTTRARFEPGKTPVLEALPPRMRPSVVEQGGDQPNSRCPLAPVKITCSK
jgi:serine/threonine protein kinase